MHGVRIIPGYPATAPNGTGWAGAIYPYEKSTGVFNCPDDTNVTTKINNETFYPLSYSMNSNFAIAPAADPNFSKNGDLVCNPRTVLAFESEGALVDMTDADEGGRISPSAYHSGAGNGLALGPGALTANGKQIRYTTGLFPGRPQIANTYDTPRHDPASMYLCADGHLKMLPPGRVSAGATAARSGPQTGAATGTAASTDHLGTQYTLTFSPR